MEEEDRPSGEWREFESGGLEATHKPDLLTLDLCRVGLFDT